MTGGLRTAVENCVFGKPCVTGLNITGTLPVYPVETMPTPLALNTIDDIPQEIKERYLGDGEKYLIGDPYIKEIAQKIAGGEKNPLAIVEAIKKHQVSVIHFVPSMLNVFLEYLSGRNSIELVKLSFLKQVFSSGETLTPSHVKNYNNEDFRQGCR